MEDGLFDTLLDDWLPIPNRTRLPCSLVDEASHPDTHCWEAPAAYPYLSDREWAGTARLLLLCAVAWAVVVALSLTFDVILAPIPDRYFALAPRGPPRGGGAGVAWRVAGVVADFFTVLLSLLLGGVFVFRSYNPSPSEDEADPPVWGVDTRRDLLDFLDMWGASFLG
eukprot:CAMPEP_0114132816 /NCGR_PEP_ID=MMETSP0043_2-20121206/13297_1 /TAXON_ID=464988 /ORGANISM="Hemiselmis andersenii, Strain CCMP644" /LENGTH=167 /DNA_ID=CAMNT_0001226357 /DNA_START=219 /DNA_END=718 /DNA_ORIENTATION=-